ncbi:MAG TPA: response regulator [Candidatus Angelobacter sp.]|nr:response regulator [Candidatus Angelobacter sp.]
MTTQPEPTAIQPVRILALEDSPADVALCAHMLKSSGIICSMDVVSDSVHFQKKLEENAYDTVFGDYHLPRWNGLEAVRWLRKAGYTMPFILITGTLGDELAVECIKEGATDYVIKDKLERLPAVLRRALREQALQAERDLAEQQLRQSERDYRSIIEGAPYGIYRASRDGDILMANPALVAMLGYQHEEELLRLNTARDIFCSSEERARSLARIQSNYGKLEVAWRKKDGREITVRLAGRRLSGPVGENAVFEVFVENITEQLTLERQFLQAQKMEAVGRLASGVAHDFNNLLMVIRGCSELLEYHINIPDKISGYVRQIQDATSVATSVVQQLMAFSRKQPPERRVVDVNAIVRDLLRMLPRLLGEDIQVVIHTGEGTHHINADRGHLEQVIMNLAVNARDAMPRGGALTIETAMVRLEQSQSGALAETLPPGNYVSLSVTDNGVGMDCDILSHLFEPFFTTKERGKGTGLGLSTVYGIVKQNGGFISVDSTPGKGTTFVIHFPAVDLPKTTEKPVRAIAPSPGGTETILLVEDEHTLREITREYLESRGYNVLSAETGAHALELCRAYDQPIHVLLTDVVMPGMSGLDLAREARQCRPGLNTIYVSGYTERSPDLNEAIETGMFLQKPYSLTDLSHKIRIACGNTR